MSTDVGVGQLVEELEQRGDRLPFEIGAFVALEACEGLLQEAVKLEADDVRVTLEGSVVVAPSAQRAEPAEAARSLVSVLSRLLVAAGPGVPPHLLQLVRESATGETQRDLRHLYDAIEASLIPLNRGASRRVLARLVRESDRPSAPQEDTIDPGELDAELDELLRDPMLRSLEPEPGSAPLIEELDDEEPVTARITVPKAVAEAHSVAAPAPASASPPASVTGAGDESGAFVVSEEVRVDSAPPPSPMAAVAAAPAAPVTTPEAQEEAVTATIRVRFPEREPQTADVPIGEVDTLSGTTAGVEVDADSGARPVSGPASGAVIESATATTRQWTAAPPPEDQRESVAGRESAVAPEAVRPSVPQPPKRRPFLTPWAPWLLVLGAGIGVYALVTTGVLERFAQSAPPGAAEAPRQSGTIEVTVAPADSQIFLFVGRGPVIAEGMSLAGPHEFVVFDRGLEPSRAVVPKDATWAATDNGALYELAVQARPSDGPSEPLDLGAPLTEPASSGEQSGTVRVITNPPGAKVYRFVGMGPKAEIPADSIHEGQEVLVYHPERSARRAVIGPSDWRVTPRQNGQTDYTASLDVALPPLPSASVLDTSEN
ncbi:MAG: hypothetical protein O7F08_10895 [Deltaproteobacteria bacterium]|nr:hypothetical protein [Deltaproteobacteria bacterium]